MSDNAKMISLAAMCETATEVGTAQLQVQNAADILRAQGITHSVGFMEVEEGPEPSVWRTDEGRVIMRVPEGHADESVQAVVVYFHDGRFRTRYLTYISEEWEVLY
jgi:hypothetical protein